MRKVTWKEFWVIRRELYFFFIALLALALALALLPSVYSAAFFLFVFGVLVLLAIISSTSAKREMRICSCGAVLHIARCPNCGCVCDNCGKKVERIE